MSEEQKRRYINTIAAENGLSAETVEKDWWVTLVLRALFTSSFAEHISFKGLCKATHKPLKRSNQQKVR